MRKCSKCGVRTKIDSTHCANCGARLSGGKFLKEKKTDPDKKSSRFVFGILIIAVLGLAAVGTLLAGLLGSGKNNTLSTFNDTHEAVVQNDIEIFSAGNISEITERVFGMESDKAFSADSDKGIVANLFANADVQVSSVGESTITYTIVSPDISDFFREKADALQAITTTEELRQALIEYAETAPQKEHMITLPYVISETGEIEIAYYDPEFINAMTGGLIDAYAGLYSQYLEGEG